MNNSIVNEQKEKENAFGKTLSGLRRKAKLTQGDMAEASEKLFSEKGKRFSIDSIRNWEGRGEYLDLENLKRLIIFFLKLGTFNEGREREEAKDLWEKARLKFQPLSHTSFDENWFATTLAEIKTAQTVNGQILESSPQLENNLSPKSPEERVPLVIVSEAISQEEVNAEIKDSIQPAIEGETLEDYLASQVIDHSPLPVLEEETKPSVDNGIEGGPPIIQDNIYPPPDNTINSDYHPIISPKPKSSLGVIISIGLTALLVISLLAVWQFNKGNNPVPVEATNSTTTTVLSPIPVASVSSKPSLFVLKDLLRDGNFLKEAIYCLGFSANSKTLASASGNSKINFWRVNANGLLDRIPLKSLTNFQTGTKDRSSWVVYSKDGKRLAVASGSGSADNIEPQKWEIAIWEVDSDGLPKTEQPFQKINPGAEHVPAFGFSYDGKLIASPGPNKSVIIWEVESGKQLTNLSGHSGQAREFSFSRDSTRLIVASGEGTVKL